MAADWKRVPGCFCKVLEGVWGLGFRGVLGFGLVGRGFRLGQRVDLILWGWGATLNP